MKRFIILLFVYVWFSSPLWATHQRAGEITFKYISGLTYEVTIVTYSYAPSPADRYELTINWGDNTTTVLKRNNGPEGQLGRQGEIVGPDIKKNLYSGIHTFPGASTYKISLEDPNRNYGILNIPNSVEVPFFIETELIINPFIGANASPQLLLPPIDQGCVNQPFIHNPGAYDPDGDSLSFRLVTCRGVGGELIPGFQLPNQIATNIGSTFTMEWRNGLKIGYITRDMQITIVTCNNSAPILAPIKDTCVEAGSKLQFKVIATDADTNAIKLTAAGAPLEIANPAEFLSPKDSISRNTGIFKWITTCAHVRKTPYHVYFKATDDDKPVNLFDLKSISITVVGPAPKNLTTIPLGNTIQLKWRKNLCSNINGYKIYRRNGSYGYTPGYCETGVPSYTGYQLISTLTKTDTVFIDNNLSRGIDYCYMVTATYPDGAESFASNEACSQLKKDLPIITHVSIQKTETVNGKVYIAWSKPSEIDPKLTPGPYKYLIFRSDNLDGTVFSLIDSTSSINDTTYIDEPLNTKDHGVSYKIEFYNNTLGNRFLIGPSQKASSVFLTLSPGDKKLKITINTLVPWTNVKFIIQRYNETTKLFDSIGSTILPAYTDNNLINGKLYCYKVKAIGTYGTAGITDPLINFSQENCGIPVDNEKPCTPKLAVNADCKNFQAVLTWGNSIPSCSSDASKYRIYYRPPQSKDMALIDSTSQTTFTHSNLLSIAGCYVVVGIDNAGNISAPSDTTCIDSDACGKYSLPNVFTPNGDERNDLFVPFPYSSVEKIDMKIVNRWGNLIFSTQDPAIKWDGKIQGSNQPVSNGVYYYVCDVYEITLNGVVKRTLKGSITVIR